MIGFHVIHFYILFFLHFIVYCNSIQVEETVKYSPYVALRIGKGSSLVLYERSIEDCPFYKSLEEDPQYFYFKDKWFIRYINVY